MLVVVEDLVMGFLAGAGFDELMRRLSIRFPALQQESPVPSLPGYDSPRLHYDDLISLASGAGLAVSGAALGNLKAVAQGVGWFFGSWMISIFKPYS